MLRPGDEPVPRYRLERILGHGGFGEVWKALGPGRTPVALKFISLGERRSLREFRAIQRIKDIRHAHLLPIHAFWVLNARNELWDDDRLLDLESTVGDARGLPDEDRPSTLILAMTLADRNLFELLEEYVNAQRTAVPPKLLLQYMEESARGLDYLNAPHHDLGQGKVAVQHCDVKPQNIVLVGNSAMLCDFGLASVLGEDHTTSAISGTPAYMAPERILNEPINSTTDQYSLAITYYELRTGRLPFVSRAYLELLAAHVQGKLDFSLVSREERRVLARATARVAGDRYPTTLEMVSSLKQAARADEPTPAPVSAPSPLATTATFPSGRTSMRETRGAVPPDAEREIPVAERQTDGAELNARMGRQVRLALIGAMAAAKQTNWPLVSTVHLWIGLTYLERGLLCRALQQRGMDPRSARHALRDAIRQQDKTNDNNVEGFSPNVKLVLDGSMNRAIREGLDEVDERHVLAAMLALPDAGAVKLLKMLKLDLSDLSIEDQTRADPEVVPSQDAPSEHVPLEEVQLFDENGSVNLPLFDNHCRSGLESACLAARRLRQDEIRPTHLLLGLLQRPGSLLADRLTPRGVSVNQLAHSLETRLGSSTATVSVEPELHRDFLDRDTRSVLRTSLSIACKAGAAAVTERELLLAILTTDHSLKKFLDDERIDFSPVC